MLAILKQNQQLNIKSNKIIATKLRNKHKINKKLINKTIIIFEQQQIFYLIKINYKSLTKSNKK